MLVCPNLTYGCLKFIEILNKIPYATRKYPEIKAFNIDKICQKRWGREKKHRFCVPDPMPPENDFTDDMK